MLLLLHAHVLDCSADLQGCKRSKVPGLVEVLLGKPIKLEFPAISDLQVLL